MPAPKKSQQKSPRKSLTKAPSKFSKRPAGRFSARPAATVPAKKSHQPERAAAFHSLRQLLEEFAPLFQVTADTAERYSLSSRGLVWRGGPLFFAEVRAGKVYTSFHLMPLYVDPSLQAVSPELAKRKQGKTCFNFKKEPSPDLIEELRDLAHRGMEIYNEKFPGWDATPS
jgi:hypothetical protein